MVDPLRVPRQTLIDIWTAWRDGYADFIAAHSRFSRAEAVAHFDDMIATLRDPAGYGAWLVPVLSGTRPGWASVRLDGGGTTRVRAGSLVAGMGRLVHPRHRGPPRGHRMTLATWTAALLLAGGDRHAARRPSPPGSASRGGRPGDAPGPTRAREGSPGPWRWSRR